MRIGCVPGTAHVLAAKSVQIRSSSGKCIIPASAVYRRGHSPKEQKAEPRQPFKAIMAKTALKGKPANAATAAVADQDAIASWIKLNKELKKPKGFFKPI